MASATTPLRALVPTQLRWKNVSCEQQHFEKHLGDPGNCLKTSLGTEALTPEGYTNLARSVVQNHRFYCTARIRPHEWATHPKSDWFFSTQLFCVAVQLTKPVITTAFHHHLQWEPHGHSDFERDLPTDGHKEDAFLEWFERCEQQSSSALAIHGHAASHVITEVTKHVGFPRCNEVCEAGE